MKCSGASLITPLGQRTVVVYVYVPDHCTQIWHLGESCLLRRPYFRGPNERGSLLVNCKCGIFGVTHTVGQRVSIDGLDC